MVSVFRLLSCRWCPALDSRSIRYVIN
ncbi:hypothetical protein C5167_041549 [Papaver somniferum]|nr:hypothetical protein C5167_041549 [Papaver somniferum]